MQPSQIHQSVVVNLILVADWFQCIPIPPLLEEHLFDNLLLLCFVPFVDMFAWFRYDSYDYDPSGSAGREQKTLP